MSITDSIRLMLGQVVQQGTGRLVRVVTALRPGVTPLGGRNTLRHTGTGGDAQWETSPGEVVKTDTHCGTLEQGETHSGRVRYTLRHTGTQRTHSGRDRYTLRHTGTGVTTDAQWERLAHTAAHWNNGHNRRTVGDLTREGGQNRYTLRNTGREQPDAQWDTLPRKS